MEPSRDDRNWFIRVVAVLGLLLLIAAVLAVVLGGRATVAGNDIVALMRLFIAASHIQVVGPMIASGIAAGAAILCAVLVPVAAVWALRTRAGPISKEDPKADR